MLICMPSLPFHNLNQYLLYRSTHLLCNLKGDLVGGTRADTGSLWLVQPSLFGGESEFVLGCCCLKTSTLGPTRDILIRDN